MAVMMENGTHWSLINGKTVCRFPIRNDGVPSGGATDTVRVDLGSLSSHVELVHLHAAWALIMGLYTGTEISGFLALDGKREDSFNQFSLTPVEANIEPTMSISDLVAGVKLQMSQNASRVVFTPEENWAKTQGLDLPYNTLVVSNVAFSHNMAEGLRDSFPVIVDLNVSNPSSSRIWYTLDHLSAGQAANLAKLLEVTALTVLQQPNSLVSTVDLLPAEQRQQILEWNSNPSEFVAGCIHMQFQEFATRQPNKIAVDSWDGTLTYSELDAASSALASQLQSSLVKKGDAVVVCSEKSKFVIIAWLAVFKSGAVLVPTDVAQPVARLQQIVDTSKAVAVVSTQKCLNIAQQLSDAVFTVDEQCLGATAPSSFRSPPTEPEDIAFIMFTSGSTGTPKGITVPHSGFCSGARKFANLFTPERFLQFASFSFTPAVYEVLMPVCTFGGCVCFPSDHDRTNDLANYMNRTRVDFAFVVPSLLRSQNPQDLKFIKTLLVFGEPISKAEAARWTSNNIKLFYAYASSENAIVSLNGRLDKLTDPKNVGYSYGDCWIVDPNNHHRLLPIGAVGEAVIYSPQTASSYLHLPEKSSAVFVDRADWMQKPREGSRFCLTGDLMYMNSDGSLSFSGRNDLMIKLRGQRIELPEVERAAMATGKVQQAVVCVPQDGKCAQRLTIVLTLKEPFPSEDEVESGDLSFVPSKVASDVTKGLQESLIEKLPVYMVPAAWIVVKSIPLTASRKTDRVTVVKWLQGMTDEAYQQLFPSSLTSEVEQPANDMEKLLQQIWGQVLKKEPETIGRNDTFIDLGGDSISAMMVISRCREHNVETTVRDIVRSKTIAELAKVVRHKQENETKPRPVDQPPTLNGGTQPTSEFEEENQHNIAQVSPVSIMQESLLHSQLKSKGEYECWFIFKVTDESGIQCEILATAWQSVVNRHSILRTIFTESRTRPGSFDQVVLRRHEAEISVFNFQNMPIDAVSILEGHKAVPKEGKPPHALTICQTESKAAFIKLDLSHLIFDGYSISVLMADLRAAACGTLPIESAPHFTSYVDFLSSQDVTQSLDYWKNRLSGLEHCSLPSLLEPTAEKVSTRQLLHLKQAIQEGSEIGRFARSRGVTVPTVLQLAWALVLRTLLNREDVAFGLLASGRELPIKGIENMVGPLINTLVCRCDLSGESLTVNETLSKIQDDFLDALSHQYVSLGQVQHALGVNRSLFSTAMSIMWSPVSGLDAIDPKIHGVRQYQPTEFDITLNVALSGTEIELEFDYWNDKISSNQSERILETYMQAIRTICSQKHTIDDLYAVSNKDLDQIRRWNRETLKPAIKTIVHDLIIQHSKTYPETQAVNSWDGNFAYSDIAELSERLARNLRKSYPHLGRGSFVPFCFEKTRWSIIAMLAILRSGSAFVPLDPSHPKDRLADIVSQCGTRVMLVSEKTLQICKDLGPDCYILQPEHLQEAAETSTHEEPLPIVQPEDDAYVIFTSGSTGRPKGVVIQHQALSFSVEQQIKFLGFRPDGRVLQFGSPAFDIIIPENLTALKIGACICIPSDADRMERLPEVLTSFNVTWVFMTPSLARTLKPSQVPTLQTLVCGGEAIAPDVIETWGAALELILAYGPTECCVICTSYVVPENAEPTSGALIGRSMGSAAWIVDPKNPNKLTPIGGVGELLMSGPMLSRGYFNDPEKTANSFIRGLAWSEDPETTFYKTGDLVKVHADGTLSFVARKDTQVKLRGQRIELSEIEVAIPIPAAVLLPREGPCRDKIVAIVPFSEENSVVVVEQDPRLVDGSKKEASKALIEGLQDVVYRRLPSYMTPTVWIVVEWIPAMVSGKLNRRLLDRWLSKMDLSTYSQISEADGAESQSAQSPQEAALLEIVSEVLNKPASSLNLRLSFIGVGGDSISAMQLTARSLARGYRLRVRDVLQAQSLSSLAAKMEQSESQISGTEKLAETYDVPFDLGPVQRMHFEQNPRGVNHFNQSFLLRLLQKFTAGAVQKALEGVIGQHGMLRARFQKIEGSWQQQVQSSVDGCLVFETYDVKDLAGVFEVAKAKQSLTNFETGPLFVATFISTPEEVFLSLVCHHLVVDLVSWRIILGDLEDLLKSRKPAPASIPFQAWAELQQKRVSDMTSVEKLDSSIGDFQSNFKYWSMHDRPNVYADVDHVVARLSSALTDSVLGVASHCRNIEPVDLMIASLLHSFGVGFPDRSVPSVFTEHHGRTTWDSSIDVTRTVGWFTTISPITVAVTAKDGVLDTLKLVKTVLRSSSDHGWRQFAQRYGPSSQRDLEGGTSDQMEVLFNFFGLTQQLEKKDSLFRPVHYDDEAMVNFDPHMSRLALFEIAALVDEGQLVIHASFNKTMAKSDRIKDWMTQFRVTLNTMVSEIVTLPVLLTTSDFPVAKLDQHQLDTFIRRLEAQGIQRGNIEDIYPCAPMQQGILLSQQKSPEQYLTRAVAKLATTSPDGVNLERIVKSWKQVVQRHAMLRTRFVSSEGDRLFDQLVLKAWASTVFMLSASGKEHEDPVTFLRSWKCEQFDSFDSPHCLGLLETRGGDVYCCLVINHAIVDAHSLDMMMSELVGNYEGKRQDQETDNPAGYGDYVAFLQTLDAEQSLNYWATYLEDITPCHFPKLQYNFQGENPNKSVHIRLNHLYEQATAFCAKNGTTLSNVFQTIWAIILGAYTGSEEVCFGYQVSGRDIELGCDPHEICGPLINTVVMRYRLDREKTINELITQAQSDYIDGIPHQHCPLIDIQHALALSGTALFNTSVSLSRPHNVKDTQGLSVETVAMYDPTEYLCSMNVEVGEAELGFIFNYQAAAMPDEMASFIADAIREGFTTVLSDADQKLGDLAIAGETSIQQIEKWNAVAPPKVERCVHDVVDEFVRLQPSHQAVCAWDLEVTYSELDLLSEILAQELRSYGVGPEVFVPLCFEKSGWHIVGILAVLKAGGACVPLDSSHPTSRLSEIAQHVEARVILTSEVQAERFAGAVDKVLVVSHKTLSEKSLTNGGEIAPKTIVQPDNAAFVVFTSGSTGKPKGSILLHSTWTTSANIYGDILHIGTHSRVLQFSAYMFDLSIADQFTTLMRGGTVCVPTETERMNDLVGAIKKYKANWAGMTPTVASLLTPEDVKGVDIMMGGEPIRKETVKLLAGHTRFTCVYGPSECCVCVLYNLEMSPDADPANLGYSFGALVWLVDPTDYNRLVPVGGVGEMLIEGPLVARGYLKEPEKTAAAFVTDPGFTKGHGRSGRKMYLTGDLGRYNADGTIQFVRRKDTQVKIRGNRVELGEIEFNLWEHPAVLHGLAFMPKAGPLAGKIVAVVSLRGFETPDGKAGLELLDFNQQSDTASSLQAVKTTLANKLPSYMVPSVWLVVQRVPLSTSGKMDRLRVNLWIERLDAGILDQIAAAEDEEDSDLQLTDMERSLIQVWARVLNRKHVARSRSFMSLGGDSLTAMQVVSQSRKLGISVTVQDVLRCQSLSELAAKATQLNTHQELADERLDVAFDLSPIQQAHFGRMPSGKERYNQSFTLKINRQVSDVQVREAIHQIANRHSMLRARFHLTGDNVWQQVISGDISGSYTFSKHQVSSEDQLQPLVNQTMASSTFDIVKGPLFAAHLIDVPVDGPQTTQCLLLIAHHLVVDLVSWRVLLHDLEEILLRRPLPSKKPLSFQVWSELQAAYSADNHDPTSVLPQTPPKTDYAFWGMEDEPNAMEDGIIANFTLSKETTLTLMGEANNAFNTEPVELMMAAVCHSFNQTFAERSSVTLFYEGHGRQAWDPAIDVTNTVGWFTTMAPLYCGENSDIRNAIVRAKDLRRRTPGSGWPFFCSQHLHEKGRQAFSDNRRPELLFNYVGMYQQLERDDSLFSQYGDFSMDSEAFNYSPDAARVALVDVLVSGRGDALQFHFVYSKRMKHQNRIQTWIHSCENFLQQMAGLLPSLSQQLTLADMPLMPLNWESLDDIQTEMRKRGANDINFIEEIYPLSKLQQGMMISQQRSEDAYLSQSVVEFTSKNPDRPINGEKVIEAWYKVVNRHPMLRTIFLDVGQRDGLANQVTLNSTKIVVRKNHYHQFDEALAALQTSEAIEFSPELPPHHVTVCTTDDKRVLFKLAMDHKIIDGYSVGVLIHDLTLAYDDQLDSGIGPHYRDYVEFVQSTSTPKQISHWKQYLEGVEPCYFPNLLDGKPKPEAQGQHITHIDIGISVHELEDFCKKSSITTFALLQTSWAIVLRAFTGSNNVCFGYLSAGRDAPVKGIDNLVGPTINMMICRLNLENSTAANVLQQCQSDFLANLEFQHASLADIHHALGIHSGALFNTILSLQKSKEDIALGGSIQTHRLSGTDPTEYAAVVDITTSSRAIDLHLECQESQISPGMAEHIASIFAQTVRSIVRDSSDLIERLDLVSPRNIEDITRWNEGEIDIVDSRVDEIIRKNAQQTPDKEAVVGWDGRFTYAELEEAADRIAHQLRIRGIGSETIVPFCFEKSVWTAAAMLGILKAGGACAALDPAYPQDRLKSIIEDTEAKLIVCSPTQQHISQGLVDQVLVISPAALEAMPPTTQTGLTGSTRDAAFVQFTSGSTGKPKGIIIEHRSMATSARAHGRAQHVRSSTRAIQFASYTFDVSVEEIFTTLQHRATVCVPSDYERMNDIGAAIARYGATWGDLTPTVAALIKPETVPSFRTLCLGGEAVRQDVVDTWAGRVELINGYGPAEASIACVVSTQDLSRDIESTNIGVGVGCKVWVVDPTDYNRLAPVGTIGELLIEGPILAREYLKDPAKTEAAFITNPKWANGESKRLYRTKDLVRYTSQGTLNFIGRSDSQVKIRGQRVELGDIEWNLSSYPEFDNTLVAFPSQGACSKQLMAVVTLANVANSAHNHGDSSMALVKSTRAKNAIVAATDWLATKLPIHMIPQTWAVVESMPLNSSGKLDRKSINTWINNMNDALYREIKDLEARDSSSTPATPLERQIQKLCGEVLNKSKKEMLLSRSFMGLGGDSISAIRLSSQAREAGLAISVQTILRAKTLAAIALGAKPVQQNRIQNIEEQVDVAFDLSPIQNLYFQLYPNGENHYNQSFALQLGRHAESNEFADAIRGLVVEHSMLRSRFEKSDDGTWRQRITHNVDASYSYSTHDIDAIGDMDDIVQGLQESLDIREGPLFRAALFNIRDNGQALFLVAHHLVIDLVSWRVIFQDLETLVTQKALSRSSKLSFQAWCSTSSAHVAAPTRGNLRQDVKIPAENVEYWGLDLQDNTFNNTRSAEFQISKDLTTMLLGCGNDPLSTETVDILLACLAFSFKQAFSDRSNAIIHVEGHGRETFNDDVDPVETVGWFTILKPFFLEADTKAGILHNLARVKDTRRVTESKPLQVFHNLANQNSNNDPTVEILFNFLGQFQQLERDEALFQPLDRRDRKWTDVNLAARRDAVIDVTASVNGGQLEVRFLYSKGIANNERLQSWVQLYRKSLENALSELQDCPPIPTLSDYPLLNVDYKDLDYILGKSLPAAGIFDVSNVEEIYPCSPIQQGMLLSQGRSSSVYQFHLVCKVKPQSDVRIELPKLQRAWETVVDRHSTLRTVVVEGPGSGGAYLQVVLKKVDVKPPIIQCQRDDPRFLSAEKAIEGSTNTPRLPQRLRICQTPEDTIFLNIEMNHVFTDGTSMSLILEDLMLAYGGTLETERPLYSDYVAFLGLQNQDANLAYWKEYLGNVSPMYLDLPNSRDIPSSLEIQKFDLGIDLQHLNDFCAANNVTISNIFHLAWAIVLRLYTNSEEVCFGYLSSGRDAPVNGVDRMVGPLINILPTRLTLDNSLTAMQGLKVVQDDFLQGLTHQYTSLADIQHALRERLHGGPLFSTVMSIQKRASSVPDDLPSQPLGIEPVGGNDPTEYDCIVGIVATDTDVSVSLTHWSDKVSIDTANSLGETLKTAVSHIVNQPERKITKLSVCSQSDLERIHAWNNRRDWTVVNDLIHERVMVQAQKRPEGQAISALDTDLTYHELDVLSTKLAAHLQGLGVGPEILVPFYFEKSAVAVVCTLAILKSGGGFVPLDPSHPMDRTETVIHTTGATIILSSPNLSPQLVRADRTVVEVSLEMLHALPELALDQQKKPTPSNVAVVIFTSGSTGVPKGVMLEHQALCTSMEAHGQAFGMGPSTRTLQFASYVFDISLHDIFSTLTHGGCVCVPTEQERLEDLAGAINRPQANWACLTTTVASILATMEPVPSLKGIVFAGEAISRDCLEAWVGKARMFNYYGPCEASIFFVGKHYDDIPADVREIGMPVYGKVWVVDPNDHDIVLPIGSVGELLLQGPLLARCYLGDMKKTESSFIQAPEFTKSVGHDFPYRCYKTGDLARLNPDGSLSYMGRNDMQVKVNGQRVELGEIEHNIRKAIGENVDVVVEQVRVGESKVLAAFLHHTQEEEPSQVPMILPALGVLEGPVSQAVSVLEKNIMAYMVPKLFLPVSKIPKTVSGKIDRRTLRELVVRVESSVLKKYSASSIAVVVQPSTPYEIALRKIWGDVLQREPSTISTDQTFAHLGGDSILAMQVVSKARAEGINILVQDIMRLRTIQKLGEKATDSDPVIHGASQLEQYSLLPVKAQPLDDFISTCISDLGIASEDDIEDAFPCSPVQEGILISQAKSPDQYKVGNCWKVTIASHAAADAELQVDVNRLTAAWNKIIQRHQGLRSYFIEAGFSEANFVQVVAKQVTAPIIKMECDTLEEFLNAEKVDTYNESDLQYLVTVCQLKSSGDVYCKLDINHVLSDALSTQLLINELSAAYTNTLPTEVAPAYGDYIAYIRSQSAEVGLQFWKYYLGDVTPSHFPSLNKTPDSVVPGLPVVQSTLHGDHTAAIKRFCGDYDVSLADIFKTMWALVLRSYLGSDAVSFGYLTSGRDAPIQNVHHIIGPLINMLIFRTKIDPSSTLLELLRDTQESYLKSLPYQYCSLKDISHAVGAGSDSLFNTIVNVLKAPSEPTGQSEARETISFEAQPASGEIEYALNLQIIDSQAGIDVTLEYWPSVVSPDQASDVVGTVLKAVDCLLGNPHKIIEEIDLLSDGNLVDVRPTNSTTNSYNGGHKDSHSKESSIVPPSTEMEVFLQTLWSQVLSIPPSDISVEESFFSHGDSLLAMQVISRARTQGVILTARQIFQYKTIAELAPHCVRAEKTLSTTADHVIPEVIQSNVPDLGVDLTNVQDIYSASPMQESILDAQESLQNSWYASWIYELQPSSPSEGISLARVLAAWQKVVDRHSILRTIFKKAPEGRRYQIVLKSFQVPVSCIASTSSDPEAIFDIFPSIPDASVPAHRLVLAETHDGKVFAQFQLSHSLYDGVSISVLWHDFQVLYTNGTLDQPAPLYREFITYLNSSDRPKATEFWQHHLRDAKLSHFPSLQGTTADLDVSFESIDVPFNGHRDVRTFCRQHGVTTGSLFQTAWALVLRQFTGVDNVTFGYMMSGRDAPIPDVDITPGPFINLMPCHVRIPSRTQLSSLLKTLQIDLAEAMMNQSCSLADIHKAISAPKTLFNTFLNIQRFQEQSPYGHSTVEMKNVGSFMTDEYAISVYVVESGDQIHVRMGYWTSVLSSSQAQTVGKALVAALEVLFVSSPTQLLDDVRLDVHIA